MIRITELSLRFGDPDSESTRELLRRAVVRRLGVREADLLGFTVYKRSHDARRKDSEISFVYIVDATVKDERAVLARHAGDRHISPTPDTGFHPPPHAPHGSADRPIVVGFGPCGLFAALVLAQQGYLNHTVFYQCLDFAQNLAWPAVFFLTSKLRNNAKCAGVIAPNRNRDQAGINRITLGRQIGWECLQRLDNFNLSFAVVPGTL